MSRRTLLLTLASLLSAGCDVSPLYRDYEGGYVGASISPKTKWSAEGELTAPAAAIDGDIHTAAHTDYSYSGAELKIDLGTSCVFQTVVIEHGRSDEGFCRTVSVATSVDGRVWVDRYSCPGTRRVTIVSLPAPVLARHVRLKALVPGTQPWSVAEVYLQ